MTELFTDLPEQRVPVIQALYYARRRSRVQIADPILIDAEYQERRKQESASIYKIVVRLRNRGYRVFRHGPTQHKVGERIMTNDELVTFALELNGCRTTK